MKKLLLLLTLLAGIADPQTATFPASIATDADLKVASNRAQTYLTSAISSTTLTIPVADASRFVNDTIVTIENENISICSVSGPNLVACSGGRGFDGTTAAVHSANKIVAAQITSYYHNRLSREVQALQRFVSRREYNVLAYGATGDGVTDDSAAISTAIAAACVSGGEVFFPAATYNAILVSNCSNISFVGQPGASVIRPVYSSGLHTALSVGGYGAGTTKVTSDVNGGFAGRAASVTKTVTVQSAAGISAGTWLQLAYAESGTRNFVQVAQVDSVNGTTLTFRQAIGIPLVASQSNTVTILSNPAQNVHVRGLVFDGSGLTGTANGTGLFRAYAIHSSTEDCIFRNWPDTGLGASSPPAFSSYIGYGNADRNLKGINAGRHNGDFWWNGETKLTVSDIQSDNLGATDAAGLNFSYLAFGQVSNISAAGNSSRCMRVLGTAWTQFSNVQANSCAENGLFITWNSYNLQIRNLMLNLDDDTSGLVIGGDDESYILVDGVKGRGNPSSFIWTVASAHHINIKNVDPFAAYTGGIGSANAIVLGAANSSLTFEGGAQYAAQYICTGTLAAGLTLYMPRPGSGVTTCGGGFNQLYEIVVPADGVVRNLRADAITGGVNASSGAVTIQKAGTGTTGVTCTFGTATTCSDTSHLYQVAAGDRLIVSITTQALETLADVLITFEY